MSFLSPSMPVGREGVVGAWSADDRGAIGSVALAA
jgi:hypothetical protein